MYFFDDERRNTFDQSMEAFLKDVHIDNRTRLAMYRMANKLELPTVEELKSYVMKNGVSPAQFREIGKLTINRIYEAFGMEKPYKAMSKSKPHAITVHAVQCKHCKWWREDSDHTCKHFYTSPRVANDFCSYGELKESEEHV